MGQQGSEICPTSHSHLNFPGAVSPNTCDGKTVLRAVWAPEKQCSFVYLMESLPAMTKTLRLQQRGAERLCWEEAKIFDMRGGKWWRDPLRG